MRRFWERFFLKDRGKIVDDGGALPNAALVTLLRKNTGNFAHKNHVCYGKGLVRTWKGYIREDLGLQREMENHDEKWFGAPGSMHANPRCVSLVSVTAAPWELSSHNFPTFSTVWLFFFFFFGNGAKF